MSRFGNAAPAGSTKNTPAKPIVKKSKKSKKANNPDKEKTHEE
jgi:hypothetical protein